MLHRKNKKKLSRRSEHRISLFRNLSKSLINHEQIITTLAKAKNLRSIVEKIITIGKENSLHSRRKIAVKLGGNFKEIDKILNILSVRYKEKNGGYTRVLKLGYRSGDKASMAVIQLVNK